MGDDRGGGEIAGQQGLRMMVQYYEFALARTNSPLMRQPHTPPTPVRPRTPRDPAPNAPMRPRTARGPTRVPFLSRSGMPENGLLRLSFWGARKNRMGIVLQQKLLGFSVGT